MQFNSSEIHLLTTVLKKYGVIDLPAHGVSMYPLIKNGDICSFKVCNPYKLNKGDIALFISGSGQLVAHRFYRVSRENKKQLFLFKGDTNLGYDEPITAQQVIAKLTQIKRENKIARVTGITDKLWKHLLPIFPFFSAWIRLFLSLRSKY